MKINGKKIRPGTSEKIVFNIARLVTGAEVEIPVYIKRAEKPGPVLLLIAGLHGDEVIGIETLRRIIKKDPELTSGTLITIPLLNVYGFLNISRYIPEGKDINRSFPGKPEGSLAEKIAGCFTKNIFPHIDYGVDIHSGGFFLDNFPHIRADLGYNKNKELAGSFAPPVIMNSAVRPGSLRAMGDQQNKPVIVFEGGKALEFNEKVNTYIYNGIMHVMRKLGMTETNIPEDEKKNIIVKDQGWLKAKYSGLFTPHAEPGQWLKKGESAGCITNLNDHSEFNVIMPADCFIIGVNRLAVVTAGDSILHLAMIE